MLRFSLKFCVSLPIVFLLTSLASAAVFDVYVDCNATLPGYGTEDRPFQEICEALPVGDNVPAGTVIHVHVASGIYRETVEMTGWINHEIDLIIEGDPNDRPIILGSEPGVDWRHAQDDVYVNDWHYNFYKGTPPYTEDNEIIWTWLYGKDPANTYRATYLLRREAVWVDGQHLRQILHAEEAAPGTFKVNQHTNRLHAWLEDGTSPNDHDVEVSVRGRGAKFIKMNHVTLRNLEFRYARAGIAVSRSRSLTIENCLVEENVQDGIIVSWLAGFTVRDSDVRRNGFSGIMPSTTVNIVLENVNISENNWRGAIVDAGNWRLAGIKFFAVSNVYMYHVTVHDNFTFGLWFDSYCENVVIDNCGLISNYASGLFWEISTGPIQLADCDIHLNGKAVREEWDLMGGASGIMISSGANLSVTNCDFVDNSPVNMSIVGSGRTAPFWRPGMQGESDQIYVLGLEIASCTFTHDLPMDLTIYIPLWLHPELFWTHSIDITPLELAEQIIPEEYQGDLEGMGGGDFTMNVFPNPANAAVVLSVNLPYETDLRVELYDVLGRRVQTYSYNQLPQGLHRTHINGHDLASGTYFARVTAGEQHVGIHKVMFLK